MTEWNCCMPLTQSILSDLPVPGSLSCKTPQNCMGLLTVTLLYMRFCSVKFIQFKELSKGQHNNGKKSGSAASSSISECCLLTLIIAVDFTNAAIELMRSPFHNPPPLCKVSHCFTGVNRVKNWDSDWFYYQSWTDTRMRLTVLWLWYWDLKNHKQTHKEGYTQNYLLYNVN